MPKEEIIPKWQKEGRENRKRKEEEEINDALKAIKDVSFALKQATLMVFIIFAAALVKAHTFGQDIVGSVITLAAAAWFGLILIGGDFKDDKLRKR